MLVVGENLGADNRRAICGTSGGLQLAQGNTRGKRPFKRVTGISRCFSKGASGFLREFIKRATDISSRCKNQRAESFLAFATVHGKLFWWHFDLFHSE